MGRYGLGRLETAECFCWVGECRCCHPCNAFVSSMPTLQLNTYHSMYKKVKHYGGRVYSQETALSDMYRKMCVYCKLNNLNKWKSI